MCCVFSGLCGVLFCGLFCGLGTPFRTPPLGTGRLPLVEGQGLVEFFYLLSDLFPAARQIYAQAARVCRQVSPRFPSRVPCLLFSRESGWSRVVTIGRNMWFIEKIEVNGGFLPGLQLSFARGLTCIIGPRGSGKSTLAEAIRFALRG